MSGPVKRSHQRRVDRPDEPDRLDPPPPEDDDDPPPLDEDDEPPPPPLEEDDALELLDADEDELEDDALEVLELEDDVPELDDCELDEELDGSVGELPHAPRKTAPPRTPIPERSLRN